MALAEGDPLPKFALGAGVPGMQPPKGDVPGRVVSGAAMDFATQANAPNDFLAAAGIPAPVPLVTGALQSYARVYFSHDPKRPIPLRGPLGKFVLSVPFAADMSVNWTIGDIGPKPGCSSYWDPQSPWYNTFYGAYGVRSHKKNGLPWGFDDAQGQQPNATEMLRVPEFDYTHLTAGQLGCPPAKQVFEVTHQDPVRALPGGWFTIDLECIIPSGLHEPLIPIAGPQVTKPPNLARAFTHLLAGAQAAAERATMMYGGYMIIMKRPADEYVAQLGAGGDYPPVAMTGSVYFKLMAPQITLAWGALCPDTAAGNALVKHILDVMGPRYGVARP